MNSFYVNFTNSKSSLFSLNTYYETEIPSLIRIPLHVVLTNLVNTNFPEPKVALTKELVYSHFWTNFGNSVHSDIYCEEVYLQKTTLTLKEQMKTRTRRKSES